MLDHLLKLKTICVNEHYIILYHEHSDTILYSLLQKLIRLLDARILKDIDMFRPTFIVKPIKSHTKI